MKKKTLPTFTWRKCIYVVAENKSAITPLKFSSLKDSENEESMITAAR